MHELLRANLGYTFLVNTMKSHSVHNLLQAKKKIERQVSEKSSLTNYS